ncbi:low affinity immunoglobulin epsilon Fc receptor-like isoform X1 [Mauremys reevesii]|uniref:low affinity immunoglobulin epsilon Fc receptor-like isoform X1 n=1 Tax=Mauremys reevesii TaxID=260615 RepID=UPI00193FF45D|nr:low affinity immunoglobulin epsilon Fc receptor-like isoform X1 [Mauremys reevesii]XP_039370992.1 low affinity immunoglobulin epsilon Fc receptor-like isoform X1 [Mauremys reevesii]
MHPDSSYHKWDNSDQVELTVQGASRVPGRGGKALCLSKFAQGKAKVILYVLLAICIAVATALIVVNLGKLSKGLAEAQVDRDTIRRDAKRNLSHHQDYLELKMSKEFNVFNSRLLNMSNELAGVRLGIEEIQADHMKDQSHLQDAIEIRNLTHSMPKERAEVRRDHDRLQEVLSRMQDELRNITEIRNLTHSMSKELAEVRRDHDRLQEVLSRVQDELWNITEVICTKCPPGWQHFEKKCYFFSTSTKSWSDAKQFCTNEGSDLVIVNTKQEQRFLSNQIMEPDVYWLGLSDSAEEGEWRWVDGSPLSVRFWASGEPNNVGQQGEDCGSFRFNGKWNDATCSLTEHWICERQC